MISLKEQEAFRNTKRLAEFGQASAQYNLGLMYANGVGVSQDFALAIFWYRQAAEKGVAAAQYILAGKYAAGQGVPRDPRQALNWYLRASDRGNSRALFKLGQMLSVPQDEIADGCFLQAAEKGVVEAQLIVGARCADADQGEDQGKASIWYRQAAENGVSAAQYIMGVRCLSGEGEARDISQAVMWFRKAARQGFPAAQSQLGMMYTRGEGVSKDNRQALLWLGRAAEQGDIEAQVQVAAMHEHGLGTPENYALASDWYAKAADQGDQRALLWMAEDAIAKGAYQEAIAHNRRAVLAGSVEAKCNLGRLLSQEHYGQLDLIGAFNMYLSAVQDGSGQAQLELARLLDREALALSTILYQKAAEGGIPEAQYLFANRLRSEPIALGISGEAESWLLLAAENEIPEAQYVIAEQRKNTSPDSIDEALGWYRRSAKHGYAKAENALGSIYATGYGVQKDNRQAASWWLKAAEKGDSDALFNLGCLFEKSGGMTAEKHAEQWYRRAMEKSVDTRALEALAAMYRRQGAETAFEWTQMAAKAGSRVDQFEYAEMLQKTGKLEIDPEALRWYLRSASKGEETALLKLGELCREFPLAFSQGCAFLAGIDEPVEDALIPDQMPAQEGAGVVNQANTNVSTVEQVELAAKAGDAQAQWFMARERMSAAERNTADEVEAHNWYRLSAQGGFVPAQAALAVFLSQGIGVLKNETEAVYWWQKAAENGDVESQYNLALMYEKGTGVAQSYIQAAAWLESAARQGLAMAMTRLGLCHATGRLGAPDMPEAFAWFAVGAAAGNEASMANRDHAESMMSEAEIKLGRRRSEAIAKEILLKKAAKK